MARSWYELFSTQIHGFGLAFLFYTRVSPSHINSFPYIYLLTMLLQHTLVDLSKNERTCICCLRNVQCLWEKILCGSKRQFYSSSFLIWEARTQTLCSTNKFVLFIEYRKCFRGHNKCMRNSQRSNLEHFSRTHTSLSIGTSSENVLIRLYFSNALTITYVENFLSVATTGVCCVLVETHHFVRPYNVCFNAQERACSQMWRRRQT